MRQPSVYDELAEVYAARADLHRLSAGAALEGLLIPVMPAGGDFLDIGCGNGVATEYMANAGFRSLGIDISEEMIRVCKRDRSSDSAVLSFEVMDFTHSSTDYHPASGSGKKFGIQFDGVLAFAFIHCFPKLHARILLRKMVRLTKVGGHIYLGTTKETISREGMEPKDDYEGAPLRYRARYTPEELEALWASIPNVRVVGQQDHPDEFGKVWYDTLLERVS